MDSKLIIPQLCPLTFTEERYEREMILNRDAFRWIQKYDTNDSIHIQFRYVSAQPEDEGINVKAYDYLGRLVQTYTPTWSTLGTYKYADVYIDCSELSGYTYFKIYAVADLLATSMPIEVGGFSDLTSIIYWHSENDFNTFFGTFSNLTVFMIRLEGGVNPSGFTPDWDMDNFSDQFSQDSQTYVKPFSTKELILGDFNGIPYYFIEKLNWIFSCDTIYINSEELTKTSKITVNWKPNKMGIGTIDMKRKINNGLQYDDYSVGILDENGSAITNETGGVLTA